MLVTEEQRRTAYSLDSIGVEVSFMVGPAAGVVVATQVSSTVALLGVGVSWSPPGSRSSWSDPPTRSAEADQAAQAVPRRAVAGGVRAWFSPGLAAVLGASAAATLVLSGTDVGVVAVLRDHGAVTLTGRRLRGLERRVDPRRDRLRRAEAARSRRCCCSAGSRS